MSQQATSKMGMGSLLAIKSPVVAINLKAGGLSLVAWSTSFLELGPVFQVLSIMVGFLSLCVLLVYNVFKARNEFRFGLSMDAEESRKRAANKKTRSN